jgi:hypothetical protein
MGCPAYVLDLKIQDGKKIPKWQPKSRRGQFLGFSKQHVSMIGLVHNIRTGSISPQFHVVYDDRFTTIPSRLDDDNIIKEDWEELLTFSRMLLIDEDDQAPKLLDEGWLLEDELKDKKRRQEQYKRNQAIPMIRQQRQQEPEN